MAKKIVLQQNDNGIKLLFSIRKDGEISNIENCIVRIKFQNSATKEEFQKVAKIVAFHPIEILLFFSSKFDLWWDDKKYRKIKGEIEDAYNREMKRQQFNKDEIMRKVYKQHTGEDMNV